MKKELGQYCTDPLYFQVISALKQIKVQQLIVLLDNIKLHDYMQIFHRCVNNPTLREDAKITLHVL